VPRQLLWNAAAVALCVLIAMSAAIAKPRHQARQNANPAAQHQAYQSPVPATLVGTYNSNDFFPSPLVLNITGADRNGNLSGAMSGMRSFYVGGETGDTWERWQNVFGRNGDRAVYRDGKINIMFRNGAVYVLDNRGNQLSGQFFAGNEKIPMTFIKSYGVAAR
jgi:hypothetical protein